MVDTIKFSQMTTGGDLAPGDFTPGLLAGTNVLFSNPWTFLAPGSTAARPVPSVAIDGRLRFNTDTLVYEYYDVFSSTWVELSGSGTGTVNPGATNDLAFYASAGTILSPILAAANSVLVTNGSSFPSLSTTLPSGLSIPGAIITASTAALTAGSVVAAPVAGTDLVNKTYADGLYTASVHSITGTTNQIIASSPTGDVTLSLPQDIATGSSPTFNNIILSGLTSHGVLVGKGAIPLTSIVLGAGQILIGTTASDPAPATLTPGQNIGITSISGSISIGFIGNLPVTNLNSGTSASASTFWRGDGSWSTPAGTGVTSVSGTLNRITSTGGTTPVIDISASYVGQTSITTLGTVATGVWQGTLISPIYGGTGVNNGTSTLTLGGSLTTSGAFASTFNMTGVTNVIFPTSGTLATTAQIPSVTPSALTEVNDTNVTLTLGGTPSTALLQAVSLTLGWSGQLSPARGGTGVNNGSNTLTLAGSLTTAGAFASTFTMTAATSVTFPTNGTLATTSQLPTGAALTEVNDTNVTLTLGGTPATSLLQAVSLTLGWAGQLAVSRGGTGVSSVTSFPSASAWAGWDSNNNFHANNYFLGYTTTVSSASPIVLTNASTQLQYITGSSAQTITLPVTSTLAVISTGYTTTYTIVNISSATSTVNSNGGNLVVSLPPGSQAVVTCISNSLNTAAAWSSDYNLNIAGVASITGTTNQVIASSSTGAVTLSLPQSIGTGNSPTFAGLTLTNPYIAGSGGLHSFQIFTTGTAQTYTKPSNVTSILVEVLGGGGGGGGVTATSGSVSFAGGGGSGGYARLFVASASSTYTYTVGAGGNGGAAGTNNGSPGGTTTFSASSLQATGGSGGVGTAGSLTSSVQTVSGGAAGVGSNGDFNVGGAVGDWGVQVLGQGNSGSGGNSHYGGGAIGLLSAATGNNASNYGSGGGGAVTGATTNRAGGNGSAGLIIVWEYA